MKDTVIMNSTKYNIRTDTILFRADANSAIGVGHVMRCLSIAGAAVSQNINVCFVLADDARRDLVAERGYQSIILGTAYDDLDGEAERFSSIVAEFKPKALIVDSYFVTDYYLSALRNVCRSINCRLVYIDDVLAFPYPCDVLLNYGIYATVAGYNSLYKDEKKAPTFLLGTSYTPLRQEFQNTVPRVVRKQGRDILCSTGGSDFTHMTLALVTEIQRCAVSELTFHVIIGAMNEDKALIYEKTEDDPNIVLYADVRNMSALMQSCDVAISAAGSTLYELCATQTPTITYILADNQIPGADGFERYGIMKCVGDVRQMGAKGLAENLVREAIRFADNYEERCQIAELQHMVVDGKGADRIIEKLASLRIN